MCLTLATLWTPAPPLDCPWDFPGKNTGVSFHFLLYGILPRFSASLATREAPIQYVVSGIKTICKCYNKMICVYVCSCSCVYVCIYIFMCVETHSSKLYQAVGCKWKILCEVIMKKFTRLLFLAMFSWNAFICYSSKEKMWHCTMGIIGQPVPTADLQAHADLSEPNPQFGLLPSISSHHLCIISLVRSLSGRTWWDRVNLKGHHKLSHELPADLVVQE